MRLFPIFCALLLGGCMGRDELVVVAPPPAVPADLLLPCPGYPGPAPATEGELSDALIAEARGRTCANRKLETINEVLAPE
ncbi:hypothetical protein G0P98_10530 [Yangia sp. PrR004]|nr:hypothetical protein [Salipiger sp. PrR004]